MTFPIARSHDSTHASAMRVSSCALGLLVVSIAWGAFSFGAVYPWAYWPLAIGLTAVGSFGLFVPLSLERRPWAIKALALTMAAFGASVVVQLVPLPHAALRAMSPDTMKVLERLDLRIGGGAASAHPLSIDPASTATGLLLFVPMALTVLGTARLFSMTRASGVARSVAAIGAILALTGIIQKALFNGKLYGFWTPFGAGDPFGPFVNRNHFAGWMLMALPLTLGLLCGGIARAMSRVKPGWRDRLLWVSSSDASRLMLLACGVLVMALSVVMTMSRSGISALAMVLCTTGILVLGRQRGRGRKAIAVAYLVALVVVVVVWVGLDPIVNRFAMTNSYEFNARRGAWADAWTIASRFPLAGTGLNTYGIATLFYQQHDLEHFYLQAHNDYLQLAAEGGVLLAVPAAAAIVVFVAAVRRRFAEETSVSTSWLRVGAVTGLAAVALQETFDFSLQMPGNAALFAVLCGIALHRAPSRGSRRDV